MRHRARRPFPLRPLPLSRVVARLRDASSGRRLAGAAGALVVAGAAVGVAIAINQEGPDPVTTAVPPMTGAEAPGTDTTSARPLTDHPSGRVSRSGKRKSVSPGATPLPSPTGPTTGPTTDASTALGSAPSSGSSGPASAQPSRSATKTSRPSPGGSTSPSQSQSPSPAPAPSPDAGPDPSPGLPVDDVPPETTATTTALDGGSWTVLLGADEPAGFACSLDGGPYAPCAVTATFTGLTHGTHTLAARATDLAGNTDPTPVQLTAKVVGPG